jgi:hypothetical protein
MVSNGEESDIYKCDSLDDVETVITEANAGLPPLHAACVAMCGCGRVVQLVVCLGFAVKQINTSRF